MVLHSTHPHSHSKPPRSPLLAPTIACLLLLWLIPLSYIATGHKEYFKSYFRVFSALSSTPASDEVVLDLRQPSGMRAVRGTELLQAATSGSGSGAAYMKGGISSGGPQDVKAAYLAAIKEMPTPMKVIHSRPTKPTVVEPGQGQVALEGEVKPTGLLDPAVEAQAPAAADAVINAQGRAAARGPAAAVGDTAAETGTNQPAVAQAGAEAGSKPAAKAAAAAAADEAPAVQVQQAHPDVAALPAVAHPAADAAASKPAAVAALAEVPADA